MGTIDGETRVHQHSPTTTTRTSARRPSAGPSQTAQGARVFQGGDLAQFTRRRAPPSHRSAQVIDPARSVFDRTRRSIVAPSSLLSRRPRARAQASREPSVWRRPGCSARFRAPPPGGARDLLANGRLYEKSLITKALQVRPCDDPSIRVRPAPALAPRARDVSIPRSDPSPAKEGPTPTST